MANESYKVVRPFNIAVKDDVSEAAQDFINFIMSKQGQAVVEENGYIPVGDQPEYKGTSPEGKIVVAGSSSISPVMEKLKEATRMLQLKYSRVILRQVCSRSLMAFVTLEWLLVN